MPGAKDPDDQLALIVSPVGAVGLAPERFAGITNSVTLCAGSVATTLVPRSECRRAA